METLPLISTPDSLVTIGNGPAEPAIAAAADGTRFQFLRKGYFYRAPADATESRMVFNCIVGLRDSWAKISQ